MGWYFSTSTSFSGVTPFHETPLGGCPANGTVSPQQNIMNWHWSSAREPTTSEYLY